MDSLLQFWNVHSLLIMDIAGTVVGLLYLWLEYRADIRLWIVGIIMPAMYLYTYYAAGLYADFGLQVYYLLASVYGYVSWRFGRHRVQTDLPITHIPRIRFLLCCAAWAVLWLLIYWILVRFTPSNVPLCDSFVNSLSIIGLWALAKKYVEQWIVWFVVDAFSCGLYIYKGIPFTAGLYGVYTVIAVFGYLKWRRMMTT